MEATTDVVHWVTIKGYKERGDGVTEFLRWNNLRWKLRQKYNWYFKYRAALMQVQHPKWYIDIHWGNEPATGKTLIQIIEAKIVAKKRNITKIENNLQLAKQHWTEMFPIEEEVDWKRAQSKLYKNKLELQTLINQLNECTISP